MRGGIDTNGLGRRVALALVACALLLRIAVPGGWMPSDQGRWIELCTGDGMVTAFVDANNRLHRSDPGEAHAAKQHCAFAGLTAPFDPPLGIDPEPLATTTEPTFALARFSVAIGQGLAAPPPPSTGPPTFTIA
ncbi:hypothetical protein ACX0GZ_03545 [Sphingomonas aestuarii]|jgi:hypothetical protein